MHTVLRSHFVKYWLGDAHQKKTLQVCNLRTLTPILLLLEMDHLLLAYYSRMHLREKDRERGERQREETVATSLVWVQYTQECWVAKTGWKHWANILGRIVSPSFDIYLQSNKALMKSAAFLILYSSWNKGREVPGFYQANSPQPPLCQTFKVHYL